MPINIVPKEDKKTRGNKKMRSTAVRNRMMDMMRTGEAPANMKEELDQVGRESDSEFRRETRDMGMKKGGMVKTAKKTKARSSCDGVAQKGHTKGRII